jgi:acyl dehydratase
MAYPRHLEDFRVGERFETGAHALTLEEVIGFAAEHDPQYFHTDPVRAKAHPLFRGLAASGFQTMTITHRLILALDMGHAWGLIGKDIRELRWRRPVRPGDTLRVRGLVIDVNRDPERPFGTVTTAVETLNQDDEPVMTFIVDAVLPARLAAEPRLEAA